MLTTTCTLAASSTSDRDVKEEAHTGAEALVPVTKSSSPIKKIGKLLAWAANSVGVSRPERLRQVQGRSGQRSERTCKGLDTAVR